MIPEYLYRYEEATYSLGVDEYDNPLPGYDLKLRLHEFKILRHTLKGAWISLYGHLFRDKKFVLIGARKRYACPSKQEALESFIARKRRQIFILEAQLEKARHALFLGQLKMEVKENG